MKIRIAQTDAEIVACYPVLRQLRPTLAEASFLGDVRRMQRERYVLASLLDPEVAAVVGYRYMEMFAFGPILYVDDLITDASRRSRGYGKAMLDWLRAEATRNGCKFLTLDSGLKRIDAHRFYEREGLEKIASHFAISTSGGPMWSSD